MKRIILGIFVSASVGCAYNPPTYSPSAYNVEAIKNSSIGKVNLTAFDSTNGNPKSIMCRAAGPISPPNEMTYKDYIYNAYKKEFELSEILDQSANPIKGTVDSVGFESMGSNGTWNIQVTFENGSNKKATIASTYEFASAFVADKACQRVAQSLSGAVEKLINDTVTNSEFKALFN